MQTINPTIVTKPILNSGRKSALAKLWRDPVARTALSVLAVFYLFAALADPLAPYSLRFSDPDLANSPPTTIHWTDRDGAWTAPFIYPVDRSFDPENYKQTYTERTTEHKPLRWFVKGEPYKLFGLLPSDIHLFGVEA